MLLHLYIFKVAPNSIVWKPILDPMHGPNQRLEIFGTSFTLFSKMWWLVSIFVKTYLSKLNFYKSFCKKVSDFHLFKTTLKYNVTILSFLHNLAWWWFDMNIQKSTKKFFMLCLCKKTKKVNIRINIHTYKSKNIQLDFFYKNWCQNTKNQNILSTSYLGILTILL